MLRAVIDTNILISARRSLASASNAVIRAVDTGAFCMLASVPLFMEYEAVLTRPEHLLAFGLSGAEVTGLLDYLAGLIEPVKLHYLWRPQLIDVADEMVLETAINGRADCIVTFNAGHFGPASKFGVDVIPPAELLRRTKS
ncbi:MAG: putative toxin-antitoxin system toxin component, PIN family [Acidocella sp. 21-58-7]|nr:MAG: putative toxin-antitoxin system toxin component, PIN family [Acidocella sp. 21-58-7]HQT65519.1 putative toxin-antitoxin system toxin component, PIN family [Acidocella sp.]